MTHPSFVATPPDRADRIKPLKPDQVAKIIERAWFSVGCPVTVRVVGDEIRSDLVNGLWVRRDAA